MSETMPAGLYRDEEWAWENSEPGSWARRALTRAVSVRAGNERKLAEMRSREEAERRRRESAPFERAELRATMPGKVGLECVLYEYLSHRTVHLREKVYVTVAVDGGGEFRPTDLMGFAFEHFPRAELDRYQMPDLFAEEHAYGKGRSPELAFACYSPLGTGAAEEAVAEIRDALEKIREVATWPEKKRTWFGMRHRQAWMVAAKRDGITPAYRPPERALPPRSGPPKPKAPDGPGGGRR